MSLGIMCGAKPRKCSWAKCVRLTLSLHKFEFAAEIIATLLPSDDTPRNSINSAIVDPLQILQADSGEGHIMKTIKALKSTVSRTRWNPRTTA